MVRAHRSNSAFRSAAACLPKGKPRYYFFFRLCQTTKTKGAAERRTGYFPFSIFQFQLASGVAARPAK
jgi:hypothetical protein